MVGGEAVWIDSRLQPAAGWEGKERRVGTNPGGSEEAWRMPPGVLMSDQLLVAGNFTHASRLTRVGKDAIKGLGEAFCYGPA